MTFTSQHHSFDIALAAEFGIEKAILIHHFQHWIRVNRNRKKNIRDGKCWSYQSRADISAHFPYFTLDSIRHHLEGLVEKGILVTANYNRAKFDKTLWYAFVDEKRFGVDEESSKNLYERGKPPTKGENPSREGENPTPIPDTKEEDTKESEDKSSHKHPPNPPKGGKSRSKIERAPEVATTEEEHQRLVEEWGLEMIQKCYLHLSEWKKEQPKNKRGGDDNRKIRNWVIGAVIKSEKNAKFLNEYKKTFTPKEKTKGNIPKWIQEMISKE